jgi:HK97 family phage prohead protease
MTIERRYLPATELRTSEDSGVRHIIGYAAVFNSLSEDLGGFREKIAPGCFGRAIKDCDVRALWNHNSDCVLGRNKSGTLALSEDAHGLKIDCTPPDAQWARDLMTSIDRGDIDQMSFGFSTITDSWGMEEGQDVRTLVDVDLYDVSPVTFPAYPDTQVAVRSKETWKKDNTEPDSNGFFDKHSIMRRRINQKEKIMEATK